LLAVIVILFLAARCEVCDRERSEAMAVVTAAGLPVASGAGAKAQFAIRTIEIADVIECIALGVRDFTRAPLYGMFFGTIYAIGGWLLVWAALALDYYYLPYPLVMGFALFAPFGAAGTYEISRRLESGEPLTWSAVLGAVWGRASRELAWLGLVSLFTLIVWLYLAALLFALFYGPQPLTLTQFFTQVVTTAYGLAFLVVGNAVGAVIALCAFSFTAVSPPLIADRPVDFVTALTTSVRAVLANPRPMLVWAVVIGTDLAISFVTLFVALLVIFPVLGHTTWHLYRRIIV
jgi:uncharacterized membrane protein